MDVVRYMSEWMSRDTCFRMLTRATEDGRHDVVDAVSKYLSGDDLCGMLLSAARRGDARVVQALLQAGADVNANEDDGSTALVRACFHGHERVAHVLLEANANVNHQNAKQRTALMYAAQNGHDLCARILLEAGADVNAETIVGIKARDLLPKGVDALAIRTAYLVRRWREAYRLRACVVFWMGHTAERLYAPEGRGRKRDRAAYEAEMA